jgi:DNA-binding GntR family transcriptional regulator
MKRAPELFLPRLSIDAESSAPLHRQVREQIASAIRGGAPPGARLPSSRALAALLGVSRNTILAAYDELVADGLVQGVRGAGMTIASPGRTHDFSLKRVLNDAQYPSRTIATADPDGTELLLRY